MFCIISSPKKSVSGSLKLAFVLRGTLIMVRFPPVGHLPVVVIHIQENEQLCCLDRLQTASNFVPSRTSAAAATSAPVEEEELIDPVAKG